jgi:hypothetical protein
MRRFALTRFFSIYHSTCSALHYRFYILPYRFVFEPFNIRYCPDFPPFCSTVPTFLCPYPDILRHHPYFPALHALSLMSRFSVFWFSLTAKMQSASFSRIFFTASFWQPTAAEASPAVSTVDHTR